MNYEERDKLIKIEQKLRRLVKRIREYRIADDPESDELNEIEYEVNEEADNIIQVALPIRVK